MKPILALLGALIVAAPTCVAAQESLSAIPATGRGIRHVLYVAIKSDNPDLTGSAHNSPDADAATITVKIRISDHSPETNFFGEVPTTVPHLDLINGSHEQKVWEDAACHHERGFPKMTVVSVNGSMMEGQQKFTVDAHIRRIGLPLPGDEVMEASSLAFGRDGRGSFIETRTETRQSCLSVDLKMYMLPCGLGSTATR